MASVRVVCFDTVQNISRISIQCAGVRCIMPVGMAEDSTCQITVCEGQSVKKGDELGMFHFGGSTHCLIFGPHVDLEFDFHGISPGINAGTNIPFNSRIATVL